MGDHRHRPREAPQRFHPPAGASDRPRRLPVRYRQRAARRRPRCWPIATAAAATSRAGACAWCPTSFPCCGIEGELNRQGEGMYDKMNGIGAHEVIIETPRPRRHARRHAGAADRRGAVGVQGARQRSEERPPLPLHPAVQESRRSGRRVARASALAADRAAGDSQAREGRGGRRQAILRFEGALHLLRHHPRRRRAPACAW